MTEPMTPEETFDKLKAMSDRLPGCEGFGWMGFANAVVSGLLGAWIGFLIIERGSPWLIAFAGVLTILVVRHAWKVGHGAYHAGYGAALIANFERVNEFVNAVKEAMGEGEA